MGQGAQQEAPRPAAPAATSDAAPAWLTPSGRGRGGSRGVLPGCRNPEWLLSKEEVLKGLEALAGEQWLQRPWGQAG